MVKPTIVDDGGWWRTMVWPSSAIVRLTIGIDHHRSPSSFLSSSVIVRLTIVRHRPSSAIFYREQGGRNKSMSYTVKKKIQITKIRQESAKPLELISRQSDVIRCFVIWYHIDSYTPRFSESSYEEYTDKIWIWFKSATTNWLLKCKSSFWSKWILELKNHFLGVRQSKANMF